MKNWMQWDSSGRGGLDVSPGAGLSRAGRAALLLMALVFQMRGFVAMASPDSTNNPTSARVRAGIQGEHNTLRNLAGEVRRLFEGRGISDAGPGAELRRVERDLAREEVAGASLEALRGRLGRAVGRAAAGYFSTADFVVWSRHRWADVGPHDWPPGKEDAPPALSVAMARRAWGSASVLVTNTRARPVEIAADIARPAGAPRVTLRRGWHVSCPDRRYRADALILMKDRKLILAPGETTCLWVQLQSVEAGRFSMPLTLRSEERSVRVELEVEVFPVDMPATVDCAVCNFSYVNEMALVRDFAPEALEDLRQHYINTFIVADALPKTTADPAGNLISPIDFSVADRGIETYGEDARLLGFFWGADLHTSLGALLFPELEFLSDPWRKAVSAWYRAWIRHLEEQGLTPDRYFMYVYDENTSPEVQAVYALLKDVAPDVRLLIDPTTGYKPDEIRAIAGDVDIWMPNYESLVAPHPEDFDFLRSTGKTLWMYSCVNGTPMPVYDYYLRRHWVGWDLGVTGIAQWAYADHGGWNSTNSWDWVRGAFAVIYTQAHAPRGLEPGEALAPSKRWEAWREGVQDFQLLTMARVAADPGGGKAVERAVSAVLERPEDSGAADRSRAALLRFLSNAGD